MFGDGAELQLATQRVGDDGINRAPDLFGVFMEGELVEDKVGGVTSSGRSIGRKCQDGLAPRIWTPFLCNLV